MDDVTQYKVDRSKWPHGPWDDEPDRIEFEAHGLPCLIVRNWGGALCGYAAVPPGHPLHGVQYNEESESLREALKQRMSRPIGEAPPLFALLAAACKDADASPTPDLALAAHGGITYSDKCNGPICHAPKAGEPDNVWWFGFDCAHHGDLMPAMGLGGKYRSVEYVRAECVKLAEQLAAIA